MAQTVLQTEMDSLYAQLSAQNNPTQSPVVDQTQPPVDITLTAPVVATPAQAPQVTQPVVDVSPIDLDALVDTWDTLEASAAQVAQVTPAAPVINYLSELAKVLNVQKDDEVLQAVEKYKQKAEVFDKVPETLSKALEIAKDGGDYLEYLNVSVVDWSKEDPITLYENYVIDQYTDPQTKTVDVERVDKLLDRIEDDEKELRGKDLQRQYINFQAQRKAGIEFEARQTKQRFEQSLKQAVDGIDNIAGFKLTPAHKTELYNFVLSGQDLKPNDLQARVVDAGLKKYWSKMDTFRKSQIKNATKRELLEQTTFPKLNTTGQLTNVSAPAEKYGISDYIKELETRRGFAPSKP